MTGSRIIRSAAPDIEVITSYDRTHFDLYLRLLDAHMQGIEWEIATTDILGLNIESPSAKACWESHLQRARWMSRTGYLKLLDLQK